MKRIYLDYNATTPLDNAVLEEMLPYLRGSFGNPSSIHHEGQVARRAIDRARERVADLVCADPEEIVFTSGGTEADNLALSGIIAGRESGRDQIVTSSIEHPAVINTCKALERRGMQVIYLPVDRDGLVDPGSLKAALSERTALVSVMLANNDVGMIEPIRELAELAGSRGIPMHVDAVQAAGKMKIDLRQVQVDLLSLSGHKLYGPKGSGALFVRRGTSLAPLLRGGAHEHGLRAGTENVPAIVGFGKACEIAADSLAEDGLRLTTLRDRLRQRIKERIDGVSIYGDAAPLLPNTLNAGFAAIEAETLLMNLDLMGISASAGSACAAGSRTPSYVLTAMGISPDAARSSIRFSLGRQNTSEEIDRTVELLVELVGRLREQALHTPDRRGES